MKTRIEKKDDVRFRAFVFYAALSFVMGLLVFGWGKALASFMAGIIVGPIALLVVRVGAFGIDDFPLPRDDEE